MLWLIKLYKLSSFFTNGEVSWRASEWCIFKHTVIHYNPRFWEMKHTLKRSIKLLFSSSYPHKAIFFLSFLGSNLGSGKLNIKWVKCGHNNFVEDKAWWWWFWISPVRIYGCEIYLWEGSDIKWHLDSATYINQYHPNHVIHGFSLRAHLTNFKDTIPTIGFCLILPPLSPCASLPNSFSIFSLLQVSLPKNIFR